MDGPRDRQTNRKYDIKSIIEQLPRVQISKTFNRFSSFFYSEAVLMAPTTYVSVEKSVDSEQEKL